MSWVATQPTGLVIQDINANVKDQEVRADVIVTGIGLLDPAHPGFAEDKAALLGALNVITARIARLRLVVFEMGEFRDKVDMAVDDIIRTIRAVPLTYSSPYGNTIVIQYQSDGLSDSYSVA